MKLYVADSNDPYVNIATEYNLFHNGDKCIFLWVNSPCVVIGRNQDPVIEVNLDYASEHNILVTRRYTGGGAVYHDMGNINYSLITDEENSDEIIYTVLSSLKRFGIEAEKNGRNDISFAGRKISGMANLYDEGHYLYHGTLMIDVDLDALSSVLTPSNLKMESKGIKSVRSRVINLKEAAENLTTEGFVQAVSAETGIRPEKVSVGDDVLRQAEYLRSDDWIYGQSPSGNIFFEERIGGEVYSFSLSVNDGIITDATINTDSLTVEKVEVLKKLITGEKFDRAGIIKAVENI